MSLDWIERPLADVIAGLASGQVTALELLHQAEACHARWDTTLHAYRRWDGDGAARRAEAADAAFRAGEVRGPLQGIPISVKDLFGVDGLDTYAGSPRALPAKWDREGALIAALGAQHAVITGKTHMVQFAFGGVGANPHWDTPRNPWDGEVYRVPGGSSSGAGVSLMEGSALLALGSDTAGSVRVPASMTGTVGLKLTASRWSTDGLVPLSTTYDTPGLLTRTAADMAIAFSALDGGDGAALAPAELSGLKLGVSEAYFWEACSPGIADAVETALGEIEAAGAERVAVTPSGLDESYQLFRAGSLTSPEFHAFLTAELPDWRAGLDPKVAARIGQAPALDSDAYRVRRDRLQGLAHAFQESLADVDVLVSPTVALTPPPVEAVAEPAAYAEANMLILRNTCIANLLGCCAVTLPVGKDAAGMPVGLQCIAKGGEDERLLAIALAMEGTLGTSADRLGRPPLGGAPS